MTRTQATHEAAVLIAAHVCHQHPRVGDLDPERIARTAVYRVACLALRGVRNT